MSRLKLVTVEDCPVPERVHVVDNREPSFPRIAGLSLEETLWGIAMAPLEAYRLEREQDGAA